MCTVVIGGTGQIGDWDLKARESDTQDILEGCRKFLPSLTSAAIQEPWVGLRPGRKSVRLESEQVETCPACLLGAAIISGHIFMGIA